MPKKQQNKKAFESYRENSLMNNLGGTCKLQNAHASMRQILSASYEFLHPFICTRYTQAFIFWSTTLCVEAFWILRRKWNLYTFESLINIFDMYTILTRAFSHDFFILMNLIPICLLPINEIIILAIWFKLRASWQNNTMVQFVFI